MDEHPDKTEIVNQNNEPLVSVVMNCFNGEAFLREAIDSVLEQTYSNWEIIFWDNCSTDSSARIFMSYDDVRMKYYLAKEHTDLGNARNLAINEAQGIWCAFLDCDDLWEPDKLRKQISLSKKYPSTELVYGVADVLIDESVEQSVWGRIMKEAQSRNNDAVLPEGNVFKELLEKNFIPLVSAVFKRSAYLSVGGVDPELKQAEDFDLFLKLAFKYEVRAVCESICSYRIHSTNITYSQLDLNYKEVEKIITRYFPLPEAKHALKVQEAKYSAILLRQGEYLNGLMRLFNKGGVLIFIKLAVSRFRRWV